MSNATLLAFGCAISFIALAGAYVFLRESFMDGPPEAEAQSEESESRLRDVA